MLGAVYNTSASDIRLTISGAGGSSQTISVKANAQYLLNSSESADPAALAAAAPGAMEKLTLSQDGTKGPQTQDFTVPVLDGSAQGYQQYLPTPSPSSSPTSSVGLHVRDRSASATSTHA